MCALSHPRVNVETQESAASWPYVPYLRALLAPRRIAACSTRVRPVRGATQTILFIAPRGFLELTRVGGHPEMSASPRARSGSSRGRHSAATHALVGIWRVGPARLVSASGRRHRCLGGSVGAAAH